MEAKQLEIYLNNRRALIDHAARIVGDRARAEDVVQDAWMKFEDAAADQKVVIEQPKSYLFRMVRNLAIDISRRLSREVGGGEADTVFQAAPETAPGPEAQLIGREELDDALTMLGTLPERMRQAFHMHRFQDMTYKEIAEALSISQGLAHRLVAQATAQCMRYMLERDQENSDGEEWKGT